MREVESDAVEWWRHDLPHAVLVAGVEIGVAWSLDGAVCSVDVTTASIYRIEIKSSI